ncbi:uncharacterized protein [Porites lutea]|uniref:uncharacterized protein n=1 Tax=Porites lutea TaxID=51062 RepID=UPI003CC605E9
MYSRMFFPLITRPTRITSNTATLIDNIFTNNLNNLSVSGLMFCDISDHLPIFTLLLDQNKNLNKTSWLSFRDKSGNNVAKFKDRLANVHWDELSECKDTDCAYRCFLDKYTTIYNDCFPLKKVKVKNVTLSKPWITKGLLKSSLSLICAPLTYIINLSLNSGVVPQEMKIARVIPLFKSGDKSLFTNYRPVSVLPVFSKFLERIVYNRLINFLNKYDILSHNQYGFRKNYSTAHALIQLYDKISNALDNKRIFAVIAKSSTKVVQHNGTHDKLGCCGHASYSHSGV